MIIIPFIPVTVKEKGGVLPPSGSNYRIKAEK
jgi:hypothetical protein